MRKSRQTLMALLFTATLLGACKMGGGPACPNHPTSATSDINSAPADSGNGGEGKDGQTCRTRQ